jgi:hypothetical protein
MNPLLLGPLVDVGKSLIDRLFPDKVAQAAERAKAELELTALQQSGRLQEIQVQMSAIIAEAQSPDPWTSRARPSFMYVIYIVILAGFPMGVLSAFRPEIAAQVAAGFQAWLSAVPDALWALFGAGYLGYTGARTFEKGKRVAK